MVAPFDLDAVRVTGPPQPARHRVAVYFGVGPRPLLTRTPDLLRPRELRVVTDWTSDIAALTASAARP
jgi:hypothetical protein